MCIGRIDSQMTDVGTLEKAVLWLLVLGLFISTFLATFMGAPVAFLAVLITTVFVVVHGTRFYGLKTILVFILVTFVISWSLESLSIAFGFPFGNYYYTGPGKIGEVPWIIMPAYLSTGYLSWMIAHILLGHFDSRLSKRDVLLIPFIGSFVMVMWDLVMDPIHATIRQEWIWEDGGFYFGVPLTNYFGWFLTVFSIYLVFSIFYHRQDSRRKASSIQDRSFWLVIPLMYLGIGLQFLLAPLVLLSNPYISWSVFLITIYPLTYRFSL